MSRTHRPRPGPPRRDELEGFLEGVRLRLVELPAEARAPAKQRLAEAERLLQAGALRDAEAALSALDAELDARQEEPELAEFPRGLVSYVPLGDRGTPTPEDDEPIANRIRLVSRLIEVRRAEGRDVAGWVAALTEARAAYAAGDRAAARRRCDAVLRAVESATGDARPTER